MKLLVLLGFRMVYHDTNSRLAEEPKERLAVTSRRVESYSIMHIIKLKMSTKEKWKYDS